MRRWAILVSLTLCMSANIFGQQDEEYYSNAVNYLEKEIVKNEDLKKFFKKEIKKKTSLGDFEVSDSIKFQFNYHFVDELSGFSNISISEFEAYEIDHFKNRYKSNGLVLTFSKPIAGSYLLAELTTNLNHKIMKFRMGKSAHLFFRFDQSGNVIQMSYKLVKYN